MRQMHMGIMAEAEITVKDLRSLLKGEPQDRWEHLLREYALEADMNPQMYESSEDESEADARVNTMFDVHRAGRLVTISCTALEHYLADDDGDYIEGSDYSWTPCMTQEQIDLIRDIVR